MSLDIAHLPSARHRVLVPTHWGRLCVSEYHSPHYQSLTNFRLYGEALYLFRMNALDLSPRTLDLFSEGLVVARIVEK